MRPCPLEEQIYDHPYSGFYIENAKNITLRNCEVVWGENLPDYYNHALESHNVDHLVMENFKGVSANPDKYTTILQD